jgi:hypothetical protein
LKRHCNDFLLSEIGCGAKTRWCFASAAGDHPIRHLPFAIRASSNRCKGIPWRHCTISTPKLPKLPKLPPKLPNLLNLQESSGPLTHAEAAAERVTLIVTVTPLVWLDGSGGGVVPAADVAVKMVETPLSVAGTVEERDGVPGWGMARAWTALRQRGGAAVRLGGPVSPPQNIAQR